MSAAEATRQRAEDMVPSQTPAPPAVLVVIVNYCTARLSIECLGSLAPEIAANPATRVVVVDNDSGDGSQERIAQAIEANGWSEWARLVASPVNGGFAYGNNLAIREALQQPAPPGIFWLLNPDTRVRAGALRTMLEFMHATPGAGIVGSSLEMEDGSAWPFAFRFPSVMSEMTDGIGFWKFADLTSRWSVLRPMEAEPALVDWLPGASMMIRREVIETVGLLDEGYFLYFEETDYCLQARRHAWEVWYLPQARVVHIAGQSTGVTDARAAPRRLPAYWFQSRRRYFVKNHGRGYAIAADLAWLVSRLLWRARQFVRARSVPEPPRLMSDFIRNSALLNAGIPMSRVVAGE